MSQADSSAGATKTTGRVEPKWRLWLQHGDIAMFGPGTHELLLHVVETGSLHQAAMRMGMSYSKAWRIVGEAEDHLGVHLLARRAGGSAGGGSALTPEGRILIDRFGALLADVQVTLEALFEKHFGDQPFIHTTGATSGDDATDDGSSAHG